MGAGSGPRVALASAAWAVRSTPVLAAAEAKGPAAAGSPEREGPAAVAGRPVPGEDGAQREGGAESHGVAARRPDPPGGAEGCCCDAGGVSGPASRRLHIPAHPCTRDAPPFSASPPTWDGTPTPTSGAASPPAPRPRQPRATRGALQVPVTLQFVLLHPPSVSDSVDCSL